MSSNSVKDASGGAPPTSGAAGVPPLADTDTPEQPDRAELGVSAGMRAGTKPGHALKTKKAVFRQPYFLRTGRDSNPRPPP